MYLGNSLVVASVLIAVWAYVYRPKLRGIDCYNVRWDNRELVVFGIVQGLSWPATVPFYAIALAFAAAAATVWGVCVGVGKGATAISQILPDAEAGLLLGKRRRK